MLISSQNLFLIILALVWITGAVLQDLKRREVDNIWNFSLIAFALGYRLAVSVFLNDYWFILNGLIGLLIFLILGNLFYYLRFFAGGDAKLLIALGTILPFSYDWIVNFKLFGFFILFFLLTGAIYVLFWSFYLVTINFNRFKLEFKKQAKNYKIMIYLGLGFFFLGIILGFFLDFVFISLGFVILLFPLLFVFAKSVEESCLIKELTSKQVTEGDWLYCDIMVHGKKIKANWEGVSRKDLELIRKYSKKKILIKQGIPFTPSFLFSFIILLFASSYGYI
ncbi:MAG: prepilin peptidase [Candidatus Pacearchaeota archaeon]|jgi:Flp pilus assembly protein protease CpaA